MVDWNLEPDDLKHYPHFDADIDVVEAMSLVTDPNRVAANPFYPFIKYDKSWQPFRSRDQRPEETRIQKHKPDKKSREIRYAARKDAYIFSYYRYILSVKYENLLIEEGLSECPIAYRRILKGVGQLGGKCNIDFAKDVFDTIDALQNCCFIALDISKCFESLDHGRLENLWCGLLGVEKLPVDHEKVFNAITKYSFVHRQQLYERLGYFGPKLKGGKIVEGYLRGFKDIPKKLCSNPEFRQKVAGGDKMLPSIIQFNSNDFGVPQGAPISDLLANLYLLEFDKFSKKIADRLGGIYRRYSDDILFVVPVSSNEAIDIEHQIIAEISKYGSRIQIKSEKTSIVRFFNDRNTLEFEHLKGRQGKNGAEYLGFRFDGRNVFIRDATISGLFRKMAGSVKSHCYGLRSRYPGKDRAYLKKHLGINHFMEKFGRVSDFGLDDAHDVCDWTFWTYARKSAEVFGSRGLPIYKQLRNCQKFVTRRMIEEL